MSDSTVHVGDIGTVIRLTILDQDGNALDISLATTLQIAFKKPNGTTVQKTAVLVGTGTDGKVYYQFVTGDLDVAGAWIAQAKVVLPGGTWYTTEALFNVSPKLFTT